VGSITPQGKLSWASMNICSQGRQSLTPSPLSTLSSNHNTIRVWGISFLVFSIHRDQNLGRAILPHLDGAPTIQKPAIDPFQLSQALSKALISGELSNRLSEESHVEEAPYQECSFGEMLNDDDDSLANLTFESANKGNGGGPLSAPATHRLQRHRSAIFYPPPAFTTVC